MPPKKLNRSQLSKSAKYYRDNPEAREKKSKTDKEINSRPEQMKKRRESGRKRYAAKKNGMNISNSDYDHSSNRFTSIKANRGRRGEGNR
jgi:hypothetical protein